jgi:hypothetical protein
MEKSIFVDGQNEEFFNDTQYNKCIIEKVKIISNGWEITFNDGWSLCVGKRDKLLPDPIVGEIAHLYGKGTGFTVRGFTSNGIVYFYRTVKEQKEKDKQWLIDTGIKRKKEYEENIEKRNKIYDSLPQCFKNRLDRLTKESEFKKEEIWDWEPYEMFILQQAVVIADTLKDPEMISEFKNLDWDKQKSLVKDLDDGHSGNTFSCACVLAYWYLKDKSKIY